MVELVLAFGIIALVVVVARLKNKNAALQAELSRLHNENPQT